jgi:hypothetical protein
MGSELGTTYEIAVNDNVVAVVEEMIASMIM